MCFCLEAYCKLPPNRIPPMACPCRSMMKTRAICFYAHAEQIYGEGWRLSGTSAHAARDAHAPRLPSVARSGKRLHTLGHTTNTRTHARTRATLTAAATLPAASHSAGAAEAVDVWKRPRSNVPSMRWVVAAAFAAHATRVTQSHGAKDSGCD